MSQSWALNSDLAPAHPSFFSLYKGQIMVPESAKDSLLISPRAGVWGVLGRAMCRVGEQLRPALPNPVPPPHPSTPHALLTTLLKDQRPQVSSLRSSPITMVSMVTASSPRLHTNCHSHSVAQPTASAVGHMKVRAIVSPTQAWGCVTWQEEAPPPCCSLSPAPVQPLPSAVPCLEPEGTVFGNLRPREQQH